MEERCSKILVITLCSDFIYFIAKNPVFLFFQFFVDFHVLPKKEEEEKLWFLSCYGITWENIYLYYIILWTPLLKKEKERKREREYDMIFKRKGRCKNKEWAREKLVLKVFPAFFCKEF